MTETPRENDATELGGSSEVYANLPADARSPDEMASDAGADGPEAQIEHDILSGLAEQVNARLNGMDAGEAIRTFNNLAATTDEDLVSRAAQEVLSDYPLTEQIVATLLSEAGPEVQAELARLLVSLYEAPTQSEVRESGQERPPYRFEALRQPRDAQYWVRTGDARYYAKSIIQTMVTQHMLAAGWQRPEGLGHYEAT